MTDVEVPVPGRVSNLAPGRRKRDRLDIPAQTPLHALSVDQHPAGG